MKRIIASVLTASMALGIAGCDAFGVRKEMSGVDHVVKEYAGALRDLDEEKVLSLTVYGEGDPEYQEIHDCFIFDGNAEYIWDIYEAVASTIDLNYLGSSIQVDGNEASVDFKYSIVDWKPLFEGSSETADDLVQAVKKSKKTNSIKGGLEFKKEDGEWKISKIKGLDELLSFSNAWPVLEVKCWPTRPTVDIEYTDPEPADPTPTVDVEKSTKRAIACFKRILEENKATIQGVEKTFNVKSCGLCDIDGNDIPELYFFAAKDDAVICVDLYIFSYNPVNDDAFLAIEVENVMYQAAGGGEYAFYTTKGPFVVVMSGGEEASYKTDTTFYDFYFTLNDGEPSTRRYRRVDSYNFDTDESSTEYYVGQSNKIPKDDYDSTVRSAAANAVEVLACNYDLKPDDELYPLLAKPHVNMLGCDEMIEYLNSL